MDVSIGTIGAASIGAVVSLLTLILSKESKTSEFRQAWVDAFRSDVAEAISATSLVFLILNSRSEDGDLSSLHEPFTRTTAALARIELRLNLREDDHLELQKLVREVEDMIRKAELGTYDQTAAEELSDRTILQTQLILKREWDRVRDGEPAFQITKASAIFVLVATALYAVVTIAS